MAVIKEEGFLVIKEGVWLKLFLDQAKCNLAELMRTYDGRLIVQKKVYLLQKMGYDMGFLYRWYIHGPYCSEVADVGLEVSRHENEYANLDERLVDAVSEDVAEKFEALDIAIPKEMSSLDWYELLASLDYVATIFVKEEVEDDRLVDEFLKRKSWYSKEEALHGLTFLKEQGLFR